MGNCLIVRKGSQPEGTATASDVLNGVTFQSANSDELQTGTLALSGDASASDVLSGKTFYNTNAQSKLTGTMTNNGNVSVTLSAGGSYTIPQGYHGGSGTVTAEALALSCTGSSYHKQVQNATQPAYTITATADGLVVFFDRSTGGAGSPTVTGATKQLVNTSEKYANLFIYQVKKGDVITISAVNTSGYSDRDCYMIYSN